ncbi:MAG: SDR family oxidoreductase [Bacteroidota bacterium]
MNQLKSKLAVVTGGNSGIGYASAKKLKENEAKVIITGCSSEKVEVTANEFRVKGIEKFLPIVNDGASITNLSSVNAYTGMPNTAVYAASKADMYSYTRTAATELAPRKIRVNSVNPGPVYTLIFEKTGMPEEMLNDFAEAMQHRVPLKRFRRSEDTTHVIAFLASDEASFITGSKYNIDGGINVNPLLVA